MTNAFNPGYLTFIGIFLLLVGCPPVDPPPEAQIEYFRSEGGRTSIERGEAVTLAWRAVNTGSCFIQFTLDGGESSELQKVPCEDERPYMPERTTNYRISALKKDGRTYVTEDLLITVASSGQDTTPPQVTSTSPLEGATDVSLDSSVSIRFSEPMAKAVTQGAFSINPAVNCDFSWTTDADALECKPRNELSNNTAYTVTLGTGATDEAGNALSAALRVEFRTTAGGTPPPQQYELVVKVAGSGKVTSSPAGIDCGSDCSETFPSGTVVSLSAAPGDGSKFAGWSGACSGSSCQLTLDADKLVTATFGPESTLIQFGTPAADQARAVSVDGSSVYVAGQTDGDLAGSNLGGADAFVRKFSSSGDVEWTRQFGTSKIDGAWAVDVDGEAVYVAGVTYGSLVGSNLGSGDAFIRKYNSSGDFLWEKQFGTSKYDRIHWVKIDGAVIYVAGDTDSALAGVSAGLKDSFIRKYTSEGDVLWTRQFGTPGNDAIWSVDVDGGALYVGGYTGGDLAGSSAGDRDAFIRKYTSEGDVLWTRQFGTSEYDAGKVDAENGSVYMVGETFGSLAGSNLGSGDAFIRKYNSSGDFLWEKQFGTSKYDAAGPMVAAGGAVYAAGNTDGNLEGSNAGGPKDVFVRKYSGGGDVLWTRQFGSSADDIVRSVDADNVNTYIAGETGGSLAGNSAGGLDAFLLIDTK